MHPVLIDIGGFRLYTYGALAAAGFLVVVGIALSDARRHGWDREQVIDLIFWTAIAAIFGARAFFFVQNPETISGLWSLLDMRNGGMVFYGAPLVGVPTGIWLLNRYGLPLWDVADSFGRTLPLAHGMSRIGCFAAGCCYGAPYDGALSVVFTDPLSAAPLDVHLHPVQLYEALLLFVLSGALFWLYDRKQFRGQVLLTWLGVYAVMRFGLELLRGDPERRFVLPQLLGDAVSTSQGVSLGLLAVVVGLWLVRRHDRVEPTPG